MTSMASLEAYADIISDMLRRHLTHADISQHLTDIGVGRGCSVMSVRFCDGHKLKRGKSDAQLEVDVSTAVAEVSNCHRKTKLPSMFTDFLTSFNFCRKD